MNEIIGQIKTWGSSLKKWWATIGKNDQKVVIGAGILGFCFLAGGLVLQGLIGGLVNLGFCRIR
jgi:hypothetical protein